MAKPDTPAPRGMPERLKPLTPSEERLIRQIYRRPPYDESEEDPGSPPPPRRGL